MNHGTDRTTQTSETDMGCERNPIFVQDLKEMETSVAFLYHGFTLNDSHVLFLLG